MDEEWTILPLEDFREDSPYFHENHDFQLVQKDGFPGSENSSETLKTPTSFSFKRNSSKFNLNGATMEISNVHPRTTLAQYLRYRPEFAGTKTLQSCIVKTVAVGPAFKLS